MNPVIETILKRKSIRAYMKKAIAPEVRAELLRATLRAPTAGNLMLYSIIEVTDQSIKNKLVRTCDNQPFIARAPLVWLFLADYQRWFDYFITSGVAQLCEQAKTPMRKPQEGDLFLACCDAIIAAQTAVIAAESLGLGSCYIGDIMENYEIQRDLFDLPKYVFPICLVCFGYPTPQQIIGSRPRASRKNSFSSKISTKGFRKQISMRCFLKTNSQTFRGRHEIMGARNVGQLIYTRKFNAEFSKEMSRSVRAILKAWLED